MFTLQLGDNFASSAEWLQQQHSKWNGSPQHDCIPTLSNWERER